LIDVLYFNLRVICCAIVSKKFIKNI